MLASFRKKYIGSRDFYMMMFKLVIPMILQNLLMNLVNLIDNIMVGRIGTEQMSAVAIVNQFHFVFMLSLFGATSGGSIYGVQFYGSGDIKGQRDTVRFRLYVNFLITALFVAVFLLFGPELIGSYLNSEGEIGDPILCASYAREYMQIMILGLLPMAFSTAYASVLREVGNTAVPMYASGSAVIANLILDYALIFGKFGLPALGVKGAAIATVISKLIEMLIVVIWTHKRTDINPCIKGLYRSLRVPIPLLKDLAWVTFPLMVNEFLWSGGIAMVNQCYSIRGMEAVAATNICWLVGNLFNVLCLQVGYCISILVGQKLGAGKLQEAKDINNKLFFLSEVLCIAVMFMLIPAGRFIPMIYNTQQEIRDLASRLIVISALALPLQGFSHCAYFTIRSGGRTWITFAFDSLYSWTVNVPLAFVLAHFTTWPLETIYAVVVFSEIIKDVIGYLMVRSDMWMRNIVSDYQ